MPKINFNVPFIDKDGKPQRRMQADRTRTRIGPEGQLIVPPVVDAEGIVQYEDVMVKDLLIEAVNANLPGDDKLTHSERLDRGKLVRKLNDSTPGSEMNYSTEQLAMIKDVITRGQATPTFVAQIEELIEGDNTAQPRGGKKKAA